MWITYQSWSLLIFLPRWATIATSMSMTYKPKRKKRATTHGFLARKNSPTGKAILKRRRQKGRKRLSNVV